MNDALERFSRLNPSLLPPIIKPVSDLVLRAAQMVQDFQKDLMEFYNVSTCIYVRKYTIPILQKETYELDLNETAEKLLTLTGRRELTYVK